MDAFERRPRIAGIVVGAVVAVPYVGVLMRDAPVSGRDLSGPPTLGAVVGLLLAGAAIARVTGALGDGFADDTDRAREAAGVAAYPGVGFAVAAPAVYGLVEPFALVLSALLLAVAAVLKGLSVATERLDPPTWARVVVGVAVGVAVAAAPGSAYLLVVALVVAVPAAVAALGGVSAWVVSVA